MSNNKRFDTYVQKLKYRVLREVIKKAYNDDLVNAYRDIPKTIIPGPKPKTRCCIYMERAIIEERIGLAMGGNKDNPNPVEVIDIACDECPVEGIYVTPACRGCIVHRCVEVCPKGAISIVDQHAVVDKEKCIECGKCTTACPYSAIILQKRPCMNACRVNALSIDENKKAKIDNDKCISCGACVYHCPFGAISDKSFVLETVDILRKSDNNKNYKVYAVIAPAIAGQFDNVTPEQVVTGIMKLGFHQVVEAALGADITLYHEAEEFKEKGILTTSCCPSFVMFVEKNFPELVQYISNSPSPMITTAKLIKESDPTAKVVFIGPCSSKKAEYKLEKNEGVVDSVISFEELQAFFAARNIEVENLEETNLDDASFYGRIFAKSGGIKEGLIDIGQKYFGIDNLNPISMSGIDECRASLLKLKMGKAAENFFEGMACDGGCLNGALCIHHGPKNALEIDKFGNKAKETDIMNSVKLYDLKKDNE
ncbi:MAG: 4Fe-4S dicluster domain-containing protein [Clostridiales bacterium]|nr:4Fe-4S dicluster domain-containing protein [Clostridiales bacterium]